MADEPTPPEGCTCDYVFETQMGNVNWRAHRTRADPDCLLHFPENDPEGLALVQAIHDRKAARE